MGTFTFKWEHPAASDVYVTGTFDDWSKSAKLDKKGDGFEKTVTLSDASEKILYKFVVDGNWCTDHTAPQENDQSGNPNNVLTPDRITKHTPATAGIMSSVAPTSTTHELAKDVPLEKAASGEVPGAFPETPATEPAAFSVNPIPATAGTGNPITLAAGEKVPEPSTITANNITSGVHDDVSLVEKSVKPEQTFSVAPIPATAGAGNPVTIPAGEGLPAHESVTGNTINSTVTTDKESYEKSDAGPPVLPPVVTPAAERESKGTGVLDLPPITKNLIPESSLPIGASGVGTSDANPTIQSVGPESTTAQLASQVPLESKGGEVPEVVKESQKEAGADPEASAIPEEVREKTAVEKELLKEVPEAPVTSDGATTAVKSAGVSAGEAGAAAGAAALAVGGAAAAYASTAKDKVADGIDQASKSTPAQTATDVKDKVATATGLGATSTPDTSNAAPEVVKESIAESGQSPEAAAYAEPIAEKKAVEKELLAEVKPETSTGESAPKIEETAAKAEEKSTAALSPPVEVKTPDSRDISPTTVPGSHTKRVLPEPATTNPDEKASTPAAAPSSSKVEQSPAEAKKNKRRSFFGRLKDKLSDKKDKA